MGELSDEDYGRQWAAMTGRKLSHDGRDCYWRSSELPAFLFALDQGLCRPHYDESHAYAALGRAMRAVHAAVPMLPEQRAGG